MMLEETGDGPTSSGTPLYENVSDVGGASSMSRKISSSKRRCHSTAIQMPRTKASRISLPHQTASNASDNPNDE
ncbi:unnamed protein product [Gongylonema pulchrum]|uniref:Uncharacterized protein n=1 Tax=Gongylonema pulchrum TaxID=637853 RepID=A0A183EPY0_9BILA|nr:unnamed protein product [Gongylonema pulchrum]